MGKHGPNEQNKFPETNLKDTEFFKFPNREIKVIFLNINDLQNTDQATIAKSGKQYMNKMKISIKRQKLKKEPDINSGTEDYNNRIEKNHWKHSIAGLLIKQKKNLKKDI